MNLGMFREGKSSWHLKIPLERVRDRDGGWRLLIGKKAKPGKAMSHFSGAVALTRNLNTFGVISVFRAKETDMSGQATHV